MYHFTYLSVKFMKEHVSTLIETFAFYFKAYERKFEINSNKEKPILI